MSKTTTALLVKFGMTFVAAAIALYYIDGNTIGQVLIFSILGTAINYLIGDLFVLPSFGNIVASVGDGILAAALAYIMDLVIPAFRTTFTSLAVLAVLVAVAEYFFHQYIARSEKVAPK